MHLNILILKSGKIPRVTTVIPNCLLIRSPLRLIFSRGWTINPTGVLEWGCTSVTHLERGDPITKTGARGPKNKSSELQLKEEDSKPREVTTGFWEPWLQKWQSTKGSSSYLVEIQ